MLEKIESAISKKQAEIEEGKSLGFDGIMLEDLEADIFLLQEIREFIDKNCLICTDMEPK